MYMSPVLCSRHIRCMCRLPPFCMHCKKTGKNVQLKDCGRCHLRKYCSKKCQNEDYAGHKESCLDYGRLNEELKELSPKLTSFQHPKFPDAGPIDLFQTVPPYMLDVSELPDLKMYLKKTKSLLVITEHHAFMFGCKYLFDMLLKKQLDHLRLCPRDIHNMRFSTVATLLMQRRDDDAYGFIKWYHTVNLDGKYDWDTPLPAGQEWVYLKNQDRYEDIFEVEPRIRMAGVPLQFLVALAVIKLKNIGKHKRRMDSYKKYEKKMAAAHKASSSGRLKQCPLAMECIKMQMVGSKLFCDIADKQTEHAKKYMGQISMTNRIFLPALFNTTPLSDHILSSTTLNTEEAMTAYKTVFISSRFLAYIPGFTAVLPGRAILFRHYEDLM